MLYKSGRSIVLTGATGFLGAFLMAGLLEREYSVTVLGRSSKNMSLTERISSLVRWFDIDPGEKLSIIETDFSKIRLGLDNKSYNSLCADAGKIIHCASDTSFTERNRERVMETNVNSLPYLLSFVADSWAEHFYYVSSAYACGVCEGTCMEVPITADKFTNIYEESKAKAESIIRRYCKDSGIPLTILRPSIVYGHSETGKALKFQALYYAVKSLLYIRDIYIKDIMEQGGERSGKWGFSLNDNGILNLPLEVYLSNRGSVNLIPVDYFVETALNIIEHPDSEGIYHITNDNPPDINTLTDFSEKFLQLKGVRAIYSQENRHEPNPAEELFNTFIKQYRPYLSDIRNFDQSRTKSITPISAPSFSYGIFENCMEYAVKCDWGKSSEFPK